MLTRQRQLRKALGRWREAHGQDYTGEPEQRHRYIEALKSSITEHEVRIAIGRMTLRDGADRKAIIRHRIQKAIEEKLDGLMLRTAHLAVGQIGPCMCVDVYFDITDAMHATDTMDAMDTMGNMGELGDGGNGGMGPL